MSWNSTVQTLTGPDIFTETQIWNAVELDMDEYGRALEIRLTNEDGGVVAFEVNP